MECSAQRQRHAIVAILRETIDWYRAIFFGRTRLFIVEGSRE
jgi:hypothetical protein